jgi:beta-phosphoglucomutase-like phosphatase (HAD superfamily)
MNKIKAIFFDMDGVLIDARDWHYEALNKALDLFGLEISRYDHLITYDGLPTREKLEMLSVERGLPRDLHEFIDAIKQQYTMEIVTVRCKPVFFHEFALAKLKSEGYKLAVCSNSIKRSVEVMIKKASLDQYVEFFISNQDVTYAKPHPEMYLQATEKSGFKPEQCLILEDNEKGIRAAEESGCHVMRIDTIEEVNYSNIKSCIQRIERGV